MDSLQCFEKPGRWYLTDNVRVASWFHAEMIGRDNEFNRPLLCDESGKRSLFPKAPGHGRDKYPWAVLRPVSQIRASEGNAKAAKDICSNDVNEDLVFRGKS